MLNNKVWDSLLAGKGGGIAKLPHALLLTGSAGVGKGEFAERLLALLLCEDPASGIQACGKCQGCHLLATGNHPDFRRLVPASAEEAGDEAASEKTGTEKSKKKSTSIVIAQIRELEEFVFVGSHRNGRRVVIIKDAEAMNVAAANALLKILEEPPPSVYFIMTTSRQKSLLPTLRSRCRVLAFAIPEPAEALAWLANNKFDASAARFLNLAGGAPARVQQWEQQGQLAAVSALVESLSTPVTDPLVLASRWDGLLKGDGPFRMEHLVDGVQRWLFDLAQESMTGKVRYHTGWPRPKEVHRLNPLALLSAWRELIQFRRSARHPLNQLLFLESLAAHLLRAQRRVNA